MLAKENIKVNANLKGLRASDYVIRRVTKEDQDDSGWRFQALIKNDSASALTDIECSLRYYDSGGRFIGRDEGFLLGSDELAKQEDKSISIELDIPSSTARAEFSLKASKTNFLEKYNFLLFGTALVTAALLLFFSDYF